jgi:urocanate hydratase
MRSQDADGPPARSRSRGTPIPAGAGRGKAAMRMLEDNCDPEVAEHPDQSSMAAARRAPATGATTRSCAPASERRGQMRSAASQGQGCTTHEWAPRVLIANSLWSWWAPGGGVRPDRPTITGRPSGACPSAPGILQGTYETFAAVAAKRFGGSRRHADRRVGGWARPAAAVTMKAAWPSSSTEPVRIARRIEYGYLDEAADGVDDARAGPPRPGTRARPAVHRPARQPPNCCPGCWPWAPRSNVVTDTVQIP